MNDCITCGICQNTVASVVHAHEGFRVSCPKCGVFRITREADAVWEAKYARSLNPRARANASGWLRENFDVELNVSDLAALVSRQTPTVGDRANKLLRELERRSTEAGSAIPMPPALNAQLSWMGVCWATAWVEVDYFITLLEQNRYVFRDGSVPTTPSYVVTPKGYEHLEELRASHTDSRVGFCAMWFSKDMDQLWSDGIEPAILAAGYLAKRIDGIHHNNRIDDEIIATIRRSKFVVADFTGHRGGVYFEAGFALGMGRPVIWTVKGSDLDKLHFDTRQYNFITWSDDKLSEFRSRLANRIEATIGHGPA